MYLILQRQRHQRLAIAAVAGGRQHEAVHAAAYGPAQLTKAPHATRSAPPSAVRTSTALTAAVGVHRRQRGGREGADAVRLARVVEKLRAHLLRAEPAAAAAAQHRRHLRRHKWRQTAEEGADRFGAPEDAQPVDGRIVRRRRAVVRDAVARAGVHGAAAQPEARRARATSACRAAHRPSPRK